MDRGSPVPDTQSDLPALGEIERTARAVVTQQTKDTRGAYYMYLVNRFLPMVFASLLVNGCAFDVYHIDLTPVQIDSSFPTKASFELREDVELDIGFGYERHLVKRTVWNHVGAIAYGDVYRSSDQVLTVEASNIYEAYLVVSAGILVGFYLPVEDAYYPLADPVRLSVQVVGPDL